MAINKKAEFARETQNLALMFKALSHPARLSILETLARRQECVCGEIVETLPLAQATVSQHLRELKDAGLIRGEIDGKTSCYCIDWDHLTALENELSGFLSEIFKFKIEQNRSCC